MTDDQLCPACNGSGEGQYDGTRCHHCNGRGTEPQDSTDDDCDHLFEQAREREFFGE